MSGRITKIIYVGPNLKAQYDSKLPADKRNLIRHFPYILSDNVLNPDKWDNVLAEIKNNGKAERWCLIDVKEKTAGSEYYPDDIPPIPEPKIIPHPVDPTFKANIGSNTSTLLGNLQDPEFYNFIQRYSQLSKSEIESDSDFKNARDCVTYLSEMLWL